jgi:CspA family cold shock protein
MKGTVKWFNDEKGYGFIRAEGFAEDIFVHHRAIRMEGRRTLVPGEPVEFTIAKSEKGVRAENVVRLSAAAGNNL